MFFLDLRQNVREVAVDADGAVLDSVRRTRVPRIQAGVYGTRVPVRHAPEGVLDDAWGVCANTNLQVEHLVVGVLAYEGVIAAGGCVPAFVLHKAAVYPKVHGHGLTAYGATRDQLGGEAPVLYRRRR